VPLWLSADSARADNYLLCPYFGINCFNPYPLGNSIGAYTAGIAFWSPTTWLAASQQGRAQAQALTSQLVLSGSFGTSSLDYLGSLSSIVAWAQSPLW
jgi:hypothetical protein